jgi:hypothetical protein
MFAYSWFYIAINYKKFNYNAQHSGMCVIWDEVKKIHKHNFKVAKHTLLNLKNTISGNLLHMPFEGRLSIVFVRILDK